MKPLNEIMEFDHIVQVHADGTVTDGPTDLDEPSLYDEQLDSDQWEMLTGYSNQQGYRGPVNHNSEYIGGGLEHDILAEPGIYVAVVAYWAPDADLDQDEDSDTAEGWAVCRYIGDKYPVSTE